jgi:hypothetical protein
MGLRIGLAALDKYSCPSWRMACTVAMSGYKSSLFPELTEKVTCSSGLRASEKPILVTMPKFDCENSPATCGPKP